MLHTKTTRRFWIAGFGVFAPASAWAYRRTVVVRRSRVVVRPGHPIARAANRTVVVRPARRTVVVGAPLVFLPVVAFTAAAAVALPARDRLVWQDTETIRRNEDWVESNFGVDERGDALYLEIDGRAELDFAEVAFENGEAQVVDFDERDFGTGIRRILEFRGKRRVKTVRLVARSKTPSTRFRVYLSE